jgi:hypothetical protein
MLCTVALLILGESQSLLLVKGNKEASLKYFLALKYTSYGERNQSSSIACTSLKVGYSGLVVILKSKISTCTDVDTLLYDIKSKSDNS